MDKLTVGLIIVICVFVCGIGSIFYYNAICDSQLAGFWKGYPEFLEDAQLTSFILYISKGTTNRKGYLLADNESGSVMNDTCNLYITFNWNSDFFNFDIREYTCKFEDLNNSNMPNKVKLEYYPKIGKIILLKNNKMFGVFFKDAVMTETMYKGAKKRKV